MINRLGSASVQPTTWRPPIARSLTWPLVLSLASMATPGTDGRAAATAFADNTMLLLPKAVALVATGSWDGLTGYECRQDGRRLGEMRCRDGVVSTFSVCEYLPSMLERTAAGRLHDPWGYLSRHQPSREQVTAVAVGACKAAWPDFAALPVEASLLGDRPLARWSSLKFKCIAKGDQGLRLHAEVDIFPWSSSVSSLERAEPLLELPVHVLVTRAAATAKAEAWGGRARPEGQCRVLSCNLKYDGQLLWVVTLGWGKLDQREDLPLFAASVRIDTRTGDLAADGPPVDVRPFKQVIGDLPSVPAPTDEYSLRLVLCDARRSEVALMSNAERHGFPWWLRRDPTPCWLEDGRLRWMATSFGQSGHAYQSVIKRGPRLFANALDGLEAVDLTNGHIDQLPACLDYSADAGGDAVVFVARDDVNGIVQLRWAVARDSFRKPIVIAGHRRGVEALCLSADASLCVYQVGNRLLAVVPQAGSRSERTIATLTRGTLRGWWEDGLSVLCSASGGAAGARERYFAIDCATGGVTDVAPTRAFSDLRPESVIPDCAKGLVFLGKPGGGDARVGVYRWTMGEAGVHCLAPDAAAPAEPARLASGQDAIDVAGQGMTKVWDAWCAEQARRLGDLPIPPAG